MLFIVLMLAVVLFLIYVYPQRDTDPLRDLKYEAHKYSGLNPELYRRFLNNMNLMKQTLSSVDTSSMYLYVALENLQDMGLEAMGGSSGFVEDLHDLASRIGNAGELLILEEAVTQGVRFNPKYIKNIPL